MKLKSNQPKATAEQVVKDIRRATSDEVLSMRSQTQALKEAVADLTVENRLLKKSMIGDGDERG